LGSVIVVLFRDAVNKPGLKSRLESQAGCGSFDRAAFTQAGRYTCRPAASSKHWSPKQSSLSNGLNRWGAKIFGEQILETVRLV
jgi:hypothetical protein